MTSIAISFDDGADVGVAYKQLKRQYPKNRIVKTDIDIAEMLEDEYLLALAMEREKNGSGVTYTHEDIMRMHGITQEELDELPEPEYGVDFV